MFAWVLDTHFVEKLLNFLRTDPIRSNAAFVLERLGVTVKFVCAATVSFLFLASCQRTDLARVKSNEGPSEALFGHRLSLVSKFFKVRVPTSDDKRCALESANATQLPRNAHPDVYKYLESLVSRIHSAALKIGSGKLPENPPEVVVISDISFNAFAMGTADRSSGQCMPADAGYQWAIYINIGVIQALNNKLTDSHVANVIGHEYAHITRGKAQHIERILGRENTKSLVSLLKAGDDSTTTNDVQILGLAEFSDYNTAIYLRPYSLKVGNYFEFVAAKEILDTEACPPAKSAAEFLIATHKSNLKNYLKSGMISDPALIKQSAMAFEEFRKVISKCPALPADDLPSFFYKGLRNVAIQQALKSKQDLKSQFDTVDQVLDRIQSEIDESLMQSKESEADQLGIALSFLAGFSDSVRKADNNEATSVEANPPTEEITPTNADSWQLARVSFPLESQITEDGFVYDLVDSHPESSTRESYMRTLEALLSNSTFVNELESLRAKRLAQTDGLEKSEGRYLISKEETERIGKQARGSN